MLIFFFQRIKEFTFVSGRHQKLGQIGAVRSKTIDCKSAPRFFFQIYVERESERDSCRTERIGERERNGSVGRDVRHRAASRIGRRLRP